MTSRRWWQGLGLIMLVALGVRVLAALTVPEIIGPDAGRYHGAALDLLAGRGFRVPDSGPLYPAFLAAIYQLFGVGNVLAVQLVQCVCWAAAIGLIGLIGRRLFDPMTGWFAAAFAAVYPPFIKYRVFGGSTYYATENLFVWLLLVMVWWLIVEERPRELFFAGIALGLATLTRSSTLFLPALIAAWLFFQRPVNLRRWAMHALIVFAAMWLVVGPWTLRNARVYRAFVPVALVTGLPLFTGNNVYARGDSIDASHWPEYAPLGFSAIEDPVERDRAYVHTVFQFWRGLTLAQHVKLIAKKFIMFWTDFGSAYNWVYGLMVPWALVGAWVTRRDRRAWVLSGMVGYTLAMCLVAFSIERMRLPVEPYLILLAAAGVLWFVRRVQDRTAVALTLGAWVALHAGLAWVWPSLSRVISFA